jgi:hypothetical protein
VVGTHGEVIMRKSKIKSTIRKKIKRRRKRKIRTTLAGGESFS